MGAHTLRQPGRTAYNMTSLVRLGESPMEHWQLQEAKARMSELVKRAQAAPQGITLHGKPVEIGRAHV